MDLDYFVDDHRFQNFDKTIDRKIRNALPNRVNVFIVTTQKVGEKIVFFTLLKNVIYQPLSNNTRWEKHEE